MENQYSEENIKVISLDEAIRLRPGMYVGDINTKGFTNLVKEILVDLKVLFEYDCAKIKLVSAYSGKIKIEGIKKPIDTKWIYYQNLGVYKIPMDRLLVVELQILKVLSTDFTLRFKDFEQVYQKGKLVKGSEDKKEINSSTLELEFTLDKQIWGNDFEFNVNYISQQIQEFAFLNKEIKFKLNYLVNNQKNKSVFYFKNGLKDKLDIEVLKGHGGIYLEMNIEMKTEIFELETVFAFYEYNVNESILKSYINKEYTSENGTHVTAVLKGIHDGFIKYIQTSDLDKDIKISKQKTLKNIIAFINLDSSIACWAGSTKQKLTNKEIIKPIANHISNLVFEKMESDKEIANDIIDKFKVG
jgi:DNA gyrase subunit B